MLETPGNYWMLAAVVLFIFEIFTPGFVLASFGLACVLASLTAYLSFGLEVQLIVFVVSSLVTFFTLRPLANKFLKPDSTLSTNVDALIGKLARVVEPIDTAANTGRVKIDGDDWRAVSQHGDSISLGETVVIKKVDSATLIVARAK
jgi:membrane protein implicated in regulation of membrane protease activity